MAGQIDDADVVIGDLMGQPVEPILDGHRRGILVDQKLDGDFRVERAILVGERAGEVVGIFGGKFELISGVGIIGDAGDQRIELWLCRGFRERRGPAAGDADLGKIARFRAGASKDAD